MERCLMGTLGKRNSWNASSSLLATATFVIDDAVIADETQLADAKLFIVGRNANKVYVSFRICRATTVH